METHTFTLKGMGCSSCVKLAEDTLGDVPGVETVTVSLEKAEASISGSFEGKSTADMLDVIKPYLPEKFTLSQTAAN